MGTFNDKHKRTDGEKQFRLHTDKTEYNSTAINKINLSKTKTKIQTKIDRLNAEVN